MTTNLLTAFQPNAFQLNAFQIHPDAQGDAADYEWLRRKARKSQHRKSEAAIAKALDKAARDKAYKAPKRKDEPWFSEPIPPPVILDVPQFDPTLAALSDPLHGLMADLARVNEMKRREEEDIEFLLLSV